MLSLFRPSALFRALSSALFSALACSAGAAHAAALADTLENQRVHGFGAPGAALDELLAAAAQAGPKAPLELRMRYHATLATVAISVEHGAHVQASLDALQRMASAEQCAPCQHYYLARETGWALRRQRLDLARAAQQRQAALPLPADRHALQAFYYARATTADTGGDHVAAIEDGLRVAELAQSLGNQADRVRALNLLMLANLGRRDLARAEAFSIEAYALAEQIGFTYMMAYVRGNQAWLYSLKSDPPRQLQALKDALRISRSQAGLHDAELINLINLGTYYADQKDYRQAAQISGQAVALAERQGKDAARGTAMLTLGHAQIETGAPDQGIATMQQAVALLEKSGARSYLADAVGELANGLERAGRHREALAALRRYVTLTAAANDAAREKIAGEAQEKFSAERKDLEIERLSLENARRAAEVSARTWQQRLWAAAALALALGAILLFQMARRARERNRVLEDSNATLSDQSVHDPLTGAFNRRHCQSLMGQQEALIVARARSRQAAPSVGLMLLDVDHFKQVNDRHGHGAGDAVLVEIAQRLNRLVRQHDVVVRWGGEEFVLVLPGTGADGMAVLAERVLRSVAEAPIEADGQRIAVTVSAGCVAYPMFAEQHWEDALKVADFAMYLAKQRGRNRAICLVRMAEGAPPDLINRDLGAAEAAGHVVLRTVQA